MSILKNPIGSALEFSCGLFEAEYEELGLFELRQLVETSVARKSKLRSQRSSANFYRVTCDLWSFGLKSDQPYCVYTG